MKIKEGFVLRDVAGHTMVIATGETSKIFHGMIKMNSTAKEIWLMIEEGLSQESIVERLSSIYNVDSCKIENDVSKIITLMKDNGIVE